MNEAIAIELVRVAKNLLSGTVTRTIRGQGWTQQEALTNALQEDESEHGHGDGYGGGAGSMRQVVRAKMVREPQKASRVKLEKWPVRKGPVEKKFIIERRWGFDRRKPIDDDRRYTQRYDTQGDVLRAAKELALQYGEELNISLAAFCMGETKLATVTPEKAVMGEWMFDVDFRE